MLIIGSGNIVHNLRRIKFSETEVFDWAHLSTPKATGVHGRWQSPGFDQLRKNRKGCHTVYPDSGSLLSTAVCAWPAREKGYCQLSGYGADVWEYFDAGGVGGGVIVDTLSAYHDTPNSPFVITL